MRYKKRGHDFDGLHKFVVFKMVEDNDIIEFLLHLHKILGKKLLMKRVR